MTDRPSIADKVRFWEEQDRINKELIPRVLKMHDLLTAHIETHEDASAQIAAAEARAVARIGKIRAQAMAIAVASLLVAATSIVVSVVL